MAAAYKLPQVILISIIHCYRLTIGSLLGHCCRFTPTCSSYAIRAISFHGCLKGCWLVLRRLSHCHPWHKGGYDPVPESKLDSHLKIPTPNHRSRVC